MSTTDTRDSRVQAAELKFLVAPDLAGAIVAWARAHLTADPHGSGPFGDQYTTTTLYTDTPGQDVFHRRGSFGRSKYRVRRYGTADVAFLERKLRTSAMLSKRRSVVDLASLGRLQRPATSGDVWPGDWFANRLATRQLHPVCQVAYDRTARLTATPYGLARLTVDRHLRAQVNTTWRYLPPEYIPALEPRHILEMKFAVAMPAIFKRLIETFDLSTAPVSKYRLSAGALGLAAPTVGDTTAVVA